MSASTRPPKETRRRGGDVARTGRPLEQPDQCGQHLYQRRRTRPRFGARFRPLRRQRRELARGRRLWSDDCRARRRFAGRARLPGAPHRPPRHSDCKSKRQTARSWPIGPSSRCRAICSPSTKSVHAGAAGENAGRGGLPLGLADKLFLSLDGADEFEPDTRLFGAHRSQRDGGLSSPAVRPAADRGLFRRPARAPSSKREGERAFFDFAVSELVALFGGAFARRVKPLRSASLGSRSVRARLLFLCAAGHGRLPRGARRAGRRSAVLRRRGLLRGRLLDRAWRLYHRRRRRPMR